MRENELPDLSRRNLVAALIALGAAIPFATYLVLVWSTATITPWQAKQMLRQSGDTLVLVDVRPRSEYEVGHLEGAVNWPREALPVAAIGPLDVPVAIRDKTWLLIDDAGCRSLAAAWQLRRNGMPDALSRAGRDSGMDPQRHPSGRRGIRPLAIQPGSGHRLAVSRARPGEQVLSVTAFFVIKPIYTLLSLLVIVLLWRETSPDLVALRWGMIFFFVGENACALNVLVWKETSYLLEYAAQYRDGHLPGIRGIRFDLTDWTAESLVSSAPHQRCAATNLCGTCIKHADVPCGLRRLFTMLIPLLIVVACMLPTADWHDTAYNTTVFGQFYPYGHLQAFPVVRELGRCAWLPVLCS